MKTYTISNTLYYDMDDIIKQNPEYMGKTKYKSTFVKKNNLTPDQYCFANIIKGNIIKLDKPRKGRRCKLYIAKNYYDNDDNDNNDNNSDSESDASHYSFDNEGDISDTEEGEDVFEKENDLTDDADDDSEDNMIKYDKIPTKIKLPAVFEYKGKEYIVTGYGKLTYNKISFRATEFEKVFSITKMSHTITNSRNKHNPVYKENKDYRYFMSGKAKRLFLTWRGLIKYSFHTKNHVLYKFSDWIVDTVFTIKLGPTEDLKKLIASLNHKLGSPVDLIKPTLMKIPCIYIFIIGFVEMVRVALNIPDTYADDDIVADIGYTDDISRRCGEHRRTFKKVAGSDLRLKSYTFVNPEDLSKAETKLKGYINACKYGYDCVIDHKNQTEIIILPQADMPALLEQYDTIGKIYPSELSKIKKIQDKQISNLENQNALLQKELEKKEILLENKDTTHESSKEIYELKLSKLELEKNAELNAKDAELKAKESQIRKLLRKLGK